MKPYYEHAGITIYHGDCRFVAPELPRFDLMLTDPPYGLGNRMTGGTWGAAKKYEDMRNWDVAPSGEDILWLATNAATSVVWGGNYFGLPASRCWLSWSKTNAVRTMAAVELAWTTLDRPALEWRGPVSTHDTGHPTQKPLALFSWCLSLFPEARSVLDPFAGSGTTGLAAKNAGVPATLIEIDERYCEISAKRLAQEVLAL